MKRVQTPCTNFLEVEKLGNTMSQTLSHDRSGSSAVYHGKKRVIVQRYLRRSYEISNRNSRYNYARRRNDVDDV
jgi:hypothetical protein